MTAKYYMGKALAKAHVHWVLQAHDSGFAPAGYEDFLFCTSANLYDMERSPSLFISLDGNANSLSNLVIAAELPRIPKRRNRAPPSFGSP